jgi:zinc/manganese transport system substrate-binding protein
MKNHPMKKLFAAGALGAFALLSTTAHAALEVFACHPEWASLAQELAGKRASVFSATTAMQDVHRIQARPSLIARARMADLVICTGADLEVGWMPMVRTQAGNPKIRAGQPGNLEIANHVPRIETPVSVDRALGDMHPMGNPHVQWSPRAVALAADEVTKRLVQIDPAGRADYEARLADFRTRWTAATARWTQLAAPLKGVPVIQHHREHSYLLDFLGMPIIGSLEPKPGVEPTSSHLQSLLEQQAATPARMVVRSSARSAQASEWLSEKAHIPAVLLPSGPGGSPAAVDLFTMYDDAIQRLLAALKPH